MKLQLLALRARCARVQIMVALAIMALFMSGHQAMAVTGDFEDVITTGLGAAKTAGMAILAAGAAILVVYITYAVIARFGKKAAGS